MEDKFILLLGTEVLDLTSQAFDLTVAIFNSGAW